MSVVDGEWKDDDGTNIVCSVCHQHTFSFDSGVYKFLRSHFVTLVLHDHGGSSPIMPLVTLPFSVRKLYMP